ncbi:UBX domain-containing protein 6-like [Biomphalaria glabrata]|uniref:UBX domain-containing protein 6-like n=1 Tax=Biomphalaria glabrata TaxID=6526 RepID=A0A9U8EG27_BIOGL|nr:UBX domain-containing protein 6-like [Biomphalaria glabrata]
MAAIKRFFEKRKLNIKFKKAGEGHRLDEPSSSVQAPKVSVASVSKPSSITREPETEAARRAAAEAALARMEAKQQMKNADSMVVQRARMKRQMEEEKRRLLEAEKKGASARAAPDEVVKDSAPMLETVLYKCPDIGPQLLPKSEMESAIHRFLLENYEDEPEMTSALMIHTLNKNKEKVKTCVETLVKYLDNIINNPTEEKFWKIRQSNKAFQERVACLKGTEQFLLAAGFSLKNLPFEDGEAAFYVFDSELAKDVDRLQNMKEILLKAEPIQPELDRDLKIFHPSKSAASFEIPDEFYAISPEELKKEHQRREEAAEKLGMLRTKAMRERDEQRELRKYRYVLLRVKFPDGILLQGVFRAQESMKQVYQFVRENLVNDWMPFHLTSGTNNKLEEGDMTLAELGLAPAAVVHFSWDADVLREATSQKGSNIAKVHLLPELMAKIQSL